MAFAIVQYAEAINSSPVTLPAAPTVGNLLIMAYAGKDVSVVVDTISSTWPPAGFTTIGSIVQAHPTFGGKAGMAYRVVQSGDGASWAYTTIDKTNVRLLEVSGLGSTLLASAVLNNQDSALMSIGIAADAGDTVIAVFATRIQSGGTFTPSVGTTQHNGMMTLGGFPDEGVLAYATSAGGATAVAGTQTSSRNPELWGGIIARFGAYVPPAVGYDVHEIIPPGTSISFVGTLAEAFDEAIRPVRNAPGSGQFSINRYSAEATATIIKPGNLIKVRYPEIDPGYIFAWFMEKGDFQLVSSNEQGGENITITGRGALSYWDRAVWLAEPFVIPWWDAGWGTPPVGAKGHVTFIAGTYRRYTIAAGVITGYVNFTTAGFEAYFDTRQTYQWPSASSQRFLVKLMAGETNAGWYVHPHQAGVTETLPSYAVGTSTSVLLSDISADKPGAILHRMFLEATNASRPTQPIPLMTIDFSATLDSNGVAWATTSALAGLTAELGETYLDTIAKLVSTGVIDVRMGPNLDMHAYNAYGTVRTSTTFAAGKVRFVKGTNIADELSRERADNPVATFVEVVGTDNVTARASLPDAATRVARETSATGDSADATVLAAMGLALLNARLVRSDAIGLRIATGTTELTGLYRPGPAGTANGKFWLGDTVTLHTGTGEQDFNQSAQRVHAITIARDEAGNLEVTPEIGSVLGEAERALFARETSKTTAFAARSMTTSTEVAEIAHADLAEHDALGLATDAELAAHTGDTIDAHDASAISFVPTGTIAATDVQAAIAEVASEAAAGDFVTTTAGGGEVLSTIAASGATETIDLATANVHDITLTANCTFTFAAVASGRARSFTLLLRQDGTGSRLATWPGSVVWPGGVAPTLATAAASVDVFAFFTLDGGTVWYGFPTGGAGASGAAGGDLLGTYPNPSVVDDSHAHTAATLPATSTGDHEHIVGETFSGDAVTTAFEIANEPMDLEAVAAYVAGVRTAVTVSGGMNTTVTFVAAPATGTDNIVIDYPAVAA